jgi:hypothetical protein
VHGPGAVPIDSSVAAYQMMTRSGRVDFVHFLNCCISSRSASRALIHARRHQRAVQRHTGTAAALPVLRDEHLDMKVLAQELEKRCCPASRGHSTNAGGLAQTIVLVVVDLVNHEQGHPPRHGRYRQGGSAVRCAVARGRCPGAVQGALRRERVRLRGGYRSQGQRAGRYQCRRDARVARPTLVRMNGSPNHTGRIVHVTGGSPALRKLDDPELVSLFASKYNIMLSTGAACSQHKTGADAASHRDHGALSAKLGPTLRVSFDHSTTTSQS